MLKQFLYVKSPTHIINCESESHVTRPPTFNEILIILHLQGGGNESGSEALHQEVQSVQGERNIL